MGNVTKIVRLHLEKMLESFGINIAGAPANRNHLKELEADPCEHTVLWHRGYNWTDRFTNLPLGRFTPPPPTNSKLQILAVLPYSPSEQPKVIAVRNLMIGIQWMNSDDCSPVAN